MTSFRFRPRFRIEDSRKPEELSQIIKEAVSKDGAPCRASIVRNFIVMSIPDSEKHKWSPQLTLQLEELDNGKTLIRGLYAPNPTIWTMFMFGYIGLGTFFFFAAIYGFARRALDMSSEMLWALPIIAFLALVLYFIAQAGQKLGAEQTFTLHHFFEGIIGSKARIN